MLVPRWNESAGSGNIEGVRSGSRQDIGPFYRFCPGATLRVFLQRYCGTAGAAIGLPVDEGSEDADVGVLRGAVVPLVLSPGVLTDHLDELVDAAGEGDDGCLLFLQIQGGVVSCQLRPALAVVDAQLKAIKALTSSMAIMSQPVI